MDSLTTSIIVGMVFLTGVALFFIISNHDGAELEITFHIKQPTLESLPPNYGLKRVEQYQNQVIFYYADKNLSTNYGNPLGQVAKGAILVYVERVTYPTTAKDFANQMIESIRNDKSTKITPQLVDINGRIGVGWETFAGADALVINGTLVDNQSVQRPAQIIFYDENDKTEYIIVGMSSIQDLLVIARSIS